MTNRGFTRTLLRGQGILPCPPGPKAQGQNSLDGYSLHSSSSSLSRSTYQVPSLNGATTYPPAPHNGGAHQPLILRPATGGVSATSHTHTNGGMPAHAYPQAAPSPAPFIPLPIIGGVYGGRPIPPPPMRGGLSYPPSYSSTYPYASSISIAPASNPHPWPYAPSPTPAPAPSPSTSYPQPIPTPSPAAHHPPSEVPSSLSAALGENDGGGEALACAEGAAALGGTTRMSSPHFSAPPPSPSSSTQSSFTSSYPTQNLPHYPMHPYAILPFTGPVSSVKLEDMVSHPHGAAKGVKRPREMGTQDPAATQAARPAPQFMSSVRDAECPAYRAPPPAYTGIRMAQGGQWWQVRCPALSSSLSTSTQPVQACGRTNVVQMLVLKSGVFLVVSMATPGVAEGGSQCEGGVCGAVPVEDRGGLALRQGRRCQGTATRQLQRRSCAL